MNDADKLIKKDRMRYTRNKLSSSLVIVAILFDVFFFVSIYKSDVGTFYYNIIIGASIIYNLVFMLLAFLSSEGVKEYNEKYSYLLIVLGIIQFVKIFIIPFKAHNTIVVVSSVERRVMESGQFVRCIVYLVLSALCLLSAAIIGIIRSRELKEYLKTLKEEVRRD